VPKLQLLPAVDVADGQAVRLVQGEAGSETRYGDPADAALAWQRDGATWVHLRLCLECGHVGCCDASPNKHATKHFHRTKHPIIRSFEPGEDWRWCYVHHLTA